MSALYLRLKIVKGGPLGFVKLQLVIKYEKNEGGTLGRLFKKNQKRIFKMRFFNSVTGPENVKGGPFGIF